MINCRKIHTSLPLIGGILCFIALLGCGGTSPAPAFNICKSQKIINGELYLKDNGPVIKLILLDEEDNPKVCSAVMVSPSIALTASHCFDEFAFEAYAEIRGARVNIKKVEIHPKAEALPTGETRNDLALVTLDSPSIVLEFITNFTKPPSVKLGDTVEIYGYGRANIDATAGLLRRGQMRVDSVDQDFIRTKFDGTGFNTCFGDSGGPAFLASNGSLQLVGTLSSGSNFSCESGDVSSFVNFQNTEVQEFLNQVTGADLRN